MYAEYNRCSYNVLFIEVHAISYSIHISYGVDTLKSVKHANIWSLKLFIFTYIVYIHIGNSIVCELICQCLRTNVTTTTVR